MDMESMPDIIGILPSGLFEFFKKQDIYVPAWTTMILVFANPFKKTFDVSMFEGAKDFFVWYSKVLIQGPDGLRTISYAKDDVLGNSGEWKLFVPPTLIGVNFRTRLRWIP